MTLSFAAILNFSFSASMVVVCGTVFGISINDVTPPAADRPSLILRRVGEESLWDMAKHYGSTEDAIRSANGLTDEPTPGQILIIPVA
jgi:hypothetical protein